MAVSRSSPPRTRPTAPLAPLVARVLRPFVAFTRVKAASGILLMVCTAAALIAANSPIADAFHHFWEREMALGLPGLSVVLPLHGWINDGLMALFFLLVGLEIKREMLVGELASMRSAALPLAAALGGMIVPALIYVAFNAGQPTVRGWGVPMATDIAFALGVLALLGDRVPLGLKVFLAALAIADDIGAVLVIAFFYTSTLSFHALGIAAVVFGLLILCNLAGVRHPGVYLALGVPLWAAVHESGVHATVAGVLLALAVPARTRIEADEFAERAETHLREFRGSGVSDRSLLTNQGQQEALQALDAALSEVQSPLLRLEHALQGLVAFGIMPLFALANAGIGFNREMAGAVTSPVSLGVALGLLFGKPVGIVLAAWIAVRLRFAELPLGVGWAKIHGAGWLGGIGFTMSLFIATLAFADEATLTLAKVGVLAGSIVAGTVGYLLVRGAAGPARAAGT